MQKYFDLVYVPTGGDLSILKNVDKVLAFTYGECTDSEAYDRDNIEINSLEYSEIQNIYNLNKNLCVILQNGGILNTDIPCNALLETYYAGQYYSAGLIKVLLGKSPCGRLAETFPIKLEHTPAYLGSATKKHTPYMEGNYIGYKYYDKKGISVAYPFGFGLSYADIRYNGFTLDNDSLSANGDILGIIEVENLSDIDSKEVLQIYYDNGDIKQLVYFDKVLLKAKELKKIPFAISYNEFMRFDQGKYVLPSESGKLILSKNARDGIFEKAVSLVGSEKPVINEDMLIEEVVALVGVKKVAEYFSKPLGLAFYANENFVLPAENGVLTENEFDRKNSMMMPLKNLPSYSEKYTKNDLQKAICELQKYLDLNINE